MTAWLGRHLPRMVLAVLVAGGLALVWPQSLGGAVSYVMVSGTSMEPGLHTGDLVAVRHQRDYAVGDVVAFRIPRGDPGAGTVVIHRITGGSGETGYLTQGDNRDGPDRWRPRDGDVVGRRWVLLPGAGAVVASLRDPLPLATLAGLMAIWVVWGGGPQPSRRRKAQTAAPATAAVAAPAPTGTAHAVPSSS